MRITTADFIKNFGVRSDQALNAPVTVTKHGRDRFVILSAEEYERLKRGVRGALRLKDLADGDRELFGLAEAKVDFTRARNDPEPRDRSGGGA
jgi:hypothetical protein